MLKYLSDVPCKKKKKIHEYIYLHIIYIYVYTYVHCGTHFPMIIALLHSFLQVSKLYHIKCQTPSVHVFVICCPRPIPSTFFFCFVYKSPR